MIDWFHTIIHIFLILMMQNIFLFRNSQFYCKAFSNVLPSSIRLQHRFLHLLDRKESNDNFNRKFSTNRSGRDGYSSNNFSNRNMKGESKVSRESSGYLRNKRESNENQDRTYERHERMAFRRDRAEKKFTNQEEPATDSRRFSGNERSTGRSQSRNDKSAEGFQFERTRRSSSEFSSRSPVRRQRDFNVSPRVSGKSNPRGVGEYNQYLYDAGTPEATTTRERRQRSPDRQSTDQRSHDHKSYDRKPQAQKDTKNESPNNQRERRPDRQSNDQRSHDQKPQSQKDTKKESPKATSGVEQSTQKSEDKPRQNNSTLPRKTPAELKEMEIQRSQLKQNISTSHESFFALQKGKANLFLEGNPIIYAGNELLIHEQNGKPLKAGDYILVTDYKGKPIGRGFYNPHSKFRIRLLTLVYDKPTSFFDQPLSTTLEHYFTQAFHLRKDILSFDNMNENEKTNSFRLINGEGDRLSGLNIDVFNNCIIVNSRAYWTEVHRSTIEQALQALISKEPYFQNKDFKIIWKMGEMKLAEDGYPIQPSNVSEDSDENIIPANKDTETNQSADELITILENGLKYQISPLIDQKTGFYCDQRENRQLIQQYVKDKDVLDLYCYAGGFALNAIKGGAKEVYAIDSSASAIERAKSNYQLNFPDKSDNIHFIEKECVQQLEEFQQAKKEFDFIICDPPNLAPSKKVLAKAEKKFEEINKLALSLINSKTGGYLFTFTCSSAVTQSNSFIPMLVKSANSVNRQVQVIKVVGTSSDHVYHLKSYQENSYFLGVLLYVQ